MALHAVYSYKDGHVVKVEEGFLDEVFEEGWGVRDVCHEEEAMFWERHVEDGEF